MADLAKVKRNVAKMVGLGAPEADIDSYIASEGTSVDEVRAFRPEFAAASALSQKLKGPIPERPEAVAPNDPNSLLQAEAQKYVLPGSGEADKLKMLADFNNAFQTGATSGMTLGFADELNAGVQAPFRAAGAMMGGQEFDLGKAYDEGLQATRGYMDEQTAKNPAASAAGDVVGSLATGGGLAKGGLTLMKGAKATLPSLAARGAAEGAIYGGVSGFGRSDGDLGGRLQDATSGAITGGLTGGAIGAVAGALAKRAANKAVPTVDELKAQAGALYDKADASGVVFPKAEVKATANDIASAALSEGLDPALHPRATAALKRLMEAGDTGATIKDVQTLRRIIAGAGKDPMNPDEARITQMMLAKFDDMVAAKSPELADARGLYHQAKKGERIEQAIELAGSRAGQFSGSGFENALRTEFRNIERQIIRGQIKGLSQEEIDAITKVARGGPIENIARYVGKLAPTGVVSFMGGGGVPFMIGNAVGGPAAGAAAAGTTMGAGLVGRALAGRMTSANAQVAAALARNGGKITAAMTPAQRAVAQAMIAAGGNELGQVPFRVPEFNVAR